MRHRRFTTIEDSYSEKQLTRFKTSKSSWFWGVSRCSSDMDDIITNIRECFYYAYIIHDEDNTEPHLHWVANILGSRSIWSMAEMLNCSPQFIQICNRPKSAQRYLLHLDDSDKHQYSISEIKTNNIDRFKSFITDNKSSVIDLWSDYLQVKQGMLTKEDFISRYSFEFAKMNFYQKIKVFDSLSKFI